MKIAVSVVVLLIGVNGLLILGCQQREAKKQYLARVGDSYLTKEEIEAIGDSTLLSSDARTHEYVMRWINNELLYQEARRQGMESSDLVQRELRETRKQLGIQAYLQKEIYGDTLSITEDSIQAYYNNQPNDFLLQEDVVRLNLIAFTGRDKANAFRTKIIQGKAWDAVVKTLTEDSLTQASMLVVITNRIYTQRTLYPSELWRVAINSMTGEISFPIKTADGFFLVQALAVYRQGKRAELDMVRDEIRQRRIVEKRRQRYTELLMRLRAQYEVEVATP